MPNPLVSVIVPTKNSSKFLEACLESIKNQTYKNIEIIVVLPEDSQEFLELANKYGIRLEYTNRGKNASRNTGVEAAQGKYVLLLDDDMILENKVIADCVDLCNTYWSSPLSSDTNLV